MDADGIAEALWNDRLMSTTNSSARTYVTITPIEGLNLTVNYAFDNKDERRRVYENPEVGDRDRRTGTFEHPK